MNDKKNNNDDGKSAVETSELKLADIDELRSAVGAAGPGSGGPGGPGPAPTVMCPAHPWDY